MGTVPQPTMKGRPPMFENLSDRLSSVFDRLTKQGALSEEDVKTALREVRVALLEADVSLSVARDFVEAVQQKATGQSVTRSITPGQQVVKIVHDALIDVLRGEGEPGALKIDNAPAPILMVGLQGSGKTTTTAKLAKREPPCRDGTAGDSGRPNRCRYAAHRQGREPRADRKARQNPGQPWRL
jgi:signal recognition particle GTPase